MLEDTFKNALKLFELMHIKCNKLLLIVLLLIPIVHALPPPEGWVNDHANIITPEWKAKITVLIDDIEKNTTAEIAVITVPSLEGKAIEELALQYLEELGVGKKETDNGVVILVALQDHEYRIETGYGVEGILPDARAGRIGREILKLYFRQELYGEGIYNTVEEIGKLLAQDPTIVAKYSPRRELITPFANQILFITFILVFFICGMAEARPTKKQQWATFITGNTLVNGALAWLGFWAPFFALIAAAIFFFIAGLVIFTLINAKPHPKSFHGAFWWGGRGGFGGIGKGSGGFGGFGGGMGGGGGAGGRW